MCSGALMCALMCALVCVHVCLFALVFACLCACVLLCLSSVCVCVCCACALHIEGRWGCADLCQQQQDEVCPKHNGLLRHTSLKY